MRARSPLLRCLSVWGSSHGYDYACLLWGGLLMKKCGTSQGSFENMGLRDEWEMGRHYVFKNLESCKWMRRATFQIHVSPYCVHTLWTQDSSDLRHFGTIRLVPKSLDISAPVSKCPRDSSALVPASQVGTFKAKSCDQIATRLQLLCYLCYLVKHSFYLE